MKKYSIQLTITLMHIQLMACLSIKIKQSSVQPPPGEDMPDRNITVRDASIEQTELFLYLGSILSVQGKSSKGVENRIQTAYSAFGKLSGRIFRNRDLTSRTKLLVYNAIVVSTLLYGCEA